MSEFALSSSEELDLNGQRSRRQKLFASDLVTSDVEQFSSTFDMRLFSKAVFNVLNKGEVNAAKYTFYGAVDPNVKWEALPDAEDKVLAAGSSVVRVLTDAYSFVRVGVVSNGEGLSTIFQVLAEGKS